MQILCVQTGGKDAEGSASTAPQGLTSFLSAQHAAFWRDLTTSLLD